MDATRIVAIRHGETDWNANALIQGLQDIALNARGRWQARRAAQSIADAQEPVSAIYSSDLARARDTALAIGQRCGLPVVDEPRLRERGFGSFEGHSFDQLERLWPQDAARWRARDVTWAPPGGETLHTLAERIRTVTDVLARRHLGRLIVLVSHGGVLDMLYRIATREPLDARRHWAIGNASINRLLWTPEGLSLVGWSDTRHLDADWRDETGA